MNRTDAEKLFNRISAEQAKRLTMIALIGSKEDDWEVAATYGERPVFFNSEFDYELWLEETK